MTANYLKVTIFSAFFGTIACQADSPGNASDSGLDTGSAQDNATAQEDLSDALQVSSSVSSSRAFEAVLAMGAASEQVFTLDAAASLVLDDDTSILEKSDAAAPPSADLGCATVGRGTGRSIDINFDGCSGAQGDVTLSRIERGLYVITFHEDFSVQDSQVTGSLALDGRASGDGQVELRMFSSDSGAEAVESLLVSGSGEEQFDAQLEFDGYLLLDRDTMSLWIFGSASVLLESDGTEASVEVRIGTDEDGVVTAPLIWTLGQDCYCPGSGFVQADLAYSLDSVVVDLDDYIDYGDSDFFQPMELDLEEPVQLTVHATVTMGPDCGDYTVEVTVDTMESIQVSLEQITDAVYQACDSLGVPSTPCDRIVDWMAEEYPDGVSVDLNDELLQTIEDMERSDLDGSMCQSDRS